MAKRFTDTDKWKKPFIRGLQGAYKLLWLYILDDCDHAGIWQVDFEVAQIRIGEKVNEDDAIKFFGDRIEVFHDGAKWFIPDFIEFQYGNLSEKNRMHLSVITLLQKNQVGAYKPLTRGQGYGYGQGEGTSKEQGEGKGEDSQEQTNEIDFTQPDIEGDEVSFPLDTPAVRQLWAKWKESRYKNHKLSYKMMGEQAALKRLQGMTFQQIESTILAAISGGWANLYPENNNGKNRTSKTNEHPAQAAARAFAERVGNKSGQQ